MAVKHGLLCPLCRNKWRYRGSLPWFDFCGDCHEKVWVNDSRKPRSCKPGVSRWQCQVREMYVRQAPPGLVEESVAKPLVEEPVATPEREDKSPPEREGRSESHIGNTAVRLGARHF